MAVSLRTIGEFEGQPVVEAVMTSEDGVMVCVMSYGASIRHWQVPVQGGQRAVVLGYPEFEPYRKDESYLGAIIGRVANRIGGSQFQLHGKTYKLEPTAPGYQLHGGPRGIGRRNWLLEPNGENSVCLSIHSPDGDMGYPGKVDFFTVYRLEGHKLSIDMSARVSEATPIAMVQHGYFNLSGDPDVLDHRVWIDAPAYTVLDSNLVTTGEFLRVDGTRYDFREPRILRAKADDPGGNDYDINFAFAKSRDKSQPAARAWAADGSLTLTLWTDQPGLQLYNGVHLGHRGLCFEDQAIPNAVNRPEFPSVIVIPEARYRHHCEIEIK